MALASIAAVARLLIQSRPAQAAEGYEIAVDAGMVREAPAGCPKGTRVTCRDLFYNMSARLKFLRTATTERSHCVQTFLRLALGARHGSFIMKEGERVLVQAPDVADGRQRVYRLTAKGRRTLAHLRASPG